MALFYQVRVSGQKYMMYELYEVDTGAKEIYCLNFHILEPINDPKLYMV